MNFQDHFSAVSEHYQQYRPSYPDELFYHLSFICQQHDCAWDCATGTGQSARALAPYFQQVIGTDASEAQIAMAISNAGKGLQFKTALAEQSGLADHSTDLITVSQAAHWFNLDAFGLEVRRVLKPQGILAIWCYTLLGVEAEIDEAINHFYYDVVGPYWPFERKLVENGYQDIELPFTPLEVPDFEMLAHWDFSQLMGYLATWSAVRLYIKEQGDDPLIELTNKLAPIWGDPAKTRTIHWPLGLRIWQNPQ